MKQELLNYLMENDKLEGPGLDEIGNGITDSAGTITMINRYEEMIKTQNKKIISFIGK